MTKKNALTIALNALNLVNTDEAIEARATLTKMVDSLSTSRAMSDEAKAKQNELRKAKTAAARAELVATVAPVLRKYLTADVSAKELYEAAKAGDQLAKKIFDFTGRILGEKFADFIEFSAPEAIVLFGGLARAKEFLTEPIRKAMDENVLPLWRGKVKLVYSQLKESDAAILGASALAWEL